ncbi:hypothetical protein [Vibrio sp. LaRot3]|uniref:hypothetical protein n=1 Tax=Vibrio sp. LaRot3 TaxID=2998829 RepID=UPI0022CDD17F|nr:hypothetical protein [Vibrio sp. LaRot3]MDA0148250.1 hypothetical protein [Vibrio sp. LaRot3]
MRLFFVLFTTLLVGCANRIPEFESASTNAQEINLYLFKQGQDANKGINSYYADPALMNELAKNSTPVALQNTFSGDATASVGGAIGGAIVGALIEAEMKAVEEYRKEIGINANNEKLEKDFHDSFSKQPFKQWDKVNLNFADGSLQLYPNNNTNELNVSISWNHYVNPVSSLIGSWLQLIYEFDIIIVDPKDNSLDTLKYYVQFDNSEADSKLHSEELILANDREKYYQLSETAFKVAAEFIYHQLDNIKREEKTELPTPVIIDGLEINHGYLNAFTSVSYSRF